MAALWTLINHALEIFYAKYDGKYPIENDLDFDLTPIEDD